MSFEAKTEEKLKMEKDSPSEDGCQSFTVIPSPLYRVDSSESNTDSSEGGDEGVSRRDRPTVPRAEHQPRSGSDDGAGEGEHLDTGVVLESRGRDDSVLDGRRSSSSDGDSSREFLLEVNET
jgi:hypothetical protein